MNGGAWRQLGICRTIKLTYISMMFSAVLDTVTRGINGCVLYGIPWGSLKKWAAGRPAKLRLLTTAEGATTLSTIVRIQGRRHFLSFSLDWTE